MLKKFLVLATVFASAGLLNGCSKCSHDDVPPPPASEPGVEQPADSTTAPADMGTAPADTEQPGVEQAPSNPATPAVPPPEDGNSGSSNESTD
jgi:hypothetical protein